MHGRQRDVSGPYRTTDNGRVLLDATHVRDGERVTGPIKCRRCERRLPVGHTRLTAEAEKTAAAGATEFLA